MSAPPALNIPHSTSTVTVSIIDTTIKVPFPVGLVLHPVVAGVEQLEANAYCFLIEHGRTGQKILFDLGTRKDFDTNAPTLVNRLRFFGVNPTIEKSVPEILQQGGMDLGDINAVVWSHHHWDHTGDMSLFPATTELVVGPGTTKLWPGYPVNQESLLLESDYTGRPTREINFEQDGISLKIGRFHAFDYFGDGSFYLLDAPGHAIGHMCGLARTTASPPTFIFMGGDTCRHAGELRPTAFLPFPDTITPSPLAPLRTAQTTSCLGEMFLSLHPSHCKTEPFFTLAVDEKGASLVCVDVGEARSTIEKTMEVDPCDDVLVVMAHDASLKDVLSYWPQSANRWQKEGWKANGTWRFLADFIKGKVGDDSHL